MGNHRQPNVGEYKQIGRVFGVLDSLVRGPRTTLELAEEHDTSERTMYRFMSGMLRECSGVLYQIRSKTSDPIKWALDLHRLQHRFSERGNHRRRRKT